MEAHSYDKKARQIETTVFKNVKPTSILLKNEIFGPILPILPIANNINEAISFIKNVMKEKPLAAYIFSENTKSIQKFLTETSSGAVSVNDIAIHAAADTLPFGGVGSSGQGAYHGDYTFECFTHEKGVAYMGAIGRLSVDALEQPYTESQTRFLSSMAGGLPFDGDKVKNFIFSIGNLAVYLTAAYFVGERIWMGRKE